MAVMGCSSTAELPVRNAPQAEAPVPSPTGVGAGPAQLQEQILAVSDAPVGGITPAKLTQDLFPGSAEVKEHSRAIALFQKTCATHTPDIPAIVAAGQSAGFDMKRNGNSAYGSKVAEGGALSLQINMASSYAYECAVTSIGNQDSDAQTRQAFFNAMGIKHRGGQGTINLGGKSYILKHLVIGGGAFGVNEHAFLIQGN